MSGLSLCVNTWNEADALERLMLSSLPAADVISEWVVLDHRSTDHTREVLDGLEPKLAREDIRLVRLREERDLSADFTFAALRNAALDACTNPIVMSVDADFILGSGFLSAAQRSLAALSEAGSRYFSAAFPVPVIWDAFETDGDGRIVRHGRVWVHSSRPRILHWPSARYVQRGKWEKLRKRPTKRAKTLSFGNGGEFLVSVNVKSDDRIALRRTMTAFMEDATRGRVSGSWLNAYAAGECREAYSDYEFVDADLVGVRLNVGRVMLP